MKTKSARRLMFVITPLVLAVAGSAFSSARAAAEPVFALEEEAWIAGRVVDSGGTALKGVTVQAYVWSRVASDYVPFTVPMPAGADGSYELAVLTEQPYRVRFSFESSGYAYEFWPDAATAAEGRDVTVTPAARTGGIDATLGPGAVIRGSVLDPLGRPLAGGSLEQTVYRYSAPLRRWIAVMGYRSLGRYYSCGGLPPGTYRLRIAPPTGTPYLKPFWYVRGTWWARGNDVLVSTGATVTLPTVRFPTRIPSRMTVHTSAKLVPEGTRVRLTVSLTERLRGRWLAGRPVRVYRSPDGRRWTYLKTLRTTSTGKALLPALIVRATKYKFWYPGEKAVLGSSGIVTVARAR